MAWYSEAIRDPGLNANYRRGRTLNQCVKEHFTVGRDSRLLIRNRGLAQFLLPKVGPPIQFAPADAVCSDSCEWNDEGPGLEFERMSWQEPLTGDQVLWGGRVTRWLHDAFGYPFVLWDGRRLPIGDRFRGFVNHGSLVHRACDQHTDGITQEDFRNMLGVPSGTPIPSTPTTPRKEGLTVMATAVDSKGFIRTYSQEGGALYEDSTRMVSGDLAPVGQFRLSTNIDKRATSADIDAQPFGDGVAVTAPLDPKIRSHSRIIFVLAIGGWQSEVAK